MSQRVPTGKRRRSIRYHLVGGLLAVIVLIGGVGGWAATAQLSGAVIAPGVLVVNSNVKTIQHPTGGIVGELLVKDGDRVDAGQVLVRLDATQTQANLAIVASNLDELMARRARLEAEQDGADTPDFTQDLLNRKNDSAVAKLLVGELKLFKIRRDSLEGQKAQLQERIAQLEEEISGLAAEASSKDREINLVRSELRGLSGLRLENLVPVTRVNGLERDLAKLQGERGQLIASTAQTRGKISETQLQIIQVDQDMRSKVGDELADVRAKISELVEREVAAEDELKRIDIRAPQGGTIHELAVHTLGGVIKAGDVIMEIVPDEDHLSVEARVSPQEIDRVSLGQDVVLRFTSFDSRATPQINGKISLISPATSFDKTRDSNYYTVHVEVPDSEIRRLGKVRLLPGMPVEVLVETGARTLISYLGKPITDQMQRALRER